jgi:hypothetical protein
MITGPWLEFKQESKFVTLKFKTPAHIWNIRCIKFSEVVSRRLVTDNRESEKLQSLHIVHDTTFLFQRRIVHYRTIKYCHISVWRIRLGKDETIGSLAPWPHISMLQYVNQVPCNSALWKSNICILATYILELHFTINVCLHISFHTAILYLQFDWWLS